MPYEKANYNAINPIYNRISKSAHLDGSTFDCAQIIMTYPCSFCLATCPSLELSFPYHKC